MGVFLNRGTDEFESAVNSMVYVDKTDMIQFLNMVINTEQRYVCVSRPRRFGKTMTANMIAAYFEKGSDSRFLFEKRKLGALSDWDRNLNQFDVIRIDIADVTSSSKSSEEALDKIESWVISEVKKAYPRCVPRNCDSVGDALACVNEKKKAKFIIIIDEWDAFFRDEKANGQLQQRYINFLRSLFKGNRSKNFVALAYITGILPIKRYNSESALNNFAEYTMLNPLNLVDYIGFTDEEVKKLCTDYDSDYNEMSSWYDGYQFEKIEKKDGKNENRTLHVFGPNSVVRAIFHGQFNNYWSKTVAFNSLAGYITMNFDGLRDAVTELVGGGHIKVKTGGFQNDMTSFSSKDDVLTLLIHLGYLAYNAATGEVFIPNKEVMECFEQTLSATGWTELVEAIDDSEKLMNNLLSGDEEAVATGIEKCHRQNTSIIKYNDENSLSAVIGIAFYAARAKYNIIREMPGGNGFADIVFLPKKGITSQGTPAVLVELKWMKTAQTAIDQIRTKNYPESLEGFSDGIILCGITYNKDDNGKKSHKCVIERI